MSTRTSGAPTVRAAAEGLCAAALFGLGAPLSKLLLPSLAPLPLAALLYLGAGVGLTAARLAARARREAPVRRADLPLLAGVVVAGGVLGPFLMLVGLQRLSGVTGSLLLNLELPFTALLAVLLFGEHLGRRDRLAMLLLGGATVLLGLRPGEAAVDAVGVAALSGACLCWALDNNLTGRLSLRDPVVVAQVKTLSAGACSMVLAMAAGASMPDAGVAVPALLIGSVSYGASLVLHVRAVRWLGAARQAALFATAPFAGAALAVPLLGDAPAPVDALAGGLMIAGVALLLRSGHAHVHTHEPLEHDHLHVHDEHHRHAHEGAFDEPHAHVHTHEPLEHDHPHVSDAHHRHEH
jgi:drug/metabolite transporter (DMT)-like permease